jgi:recombination protein RecT
MTTNALEIVSSDVYLARAAFDATRINKAANFDAEAGFAIQQLGRKDYTLTVGMNARQSVVDAVVNVAAIGVSLNPARKQAYLVPRDGRICLDISYMGLMDLAIEAGAIKWAQAALVYQNDTFTLHGLDKAPTHSHDPFSKDRGECVGVYCTVKTNAGDYLTHTMTYADALAIRDRSAAWKSNQSGPWKTDQAEMVKKTCVKQAYKYWPKSEGVDRAIQYMNEVAGEGIVTEREPFADDMDKLTADMVQLHYEEKNGVQAVKLWYENEWIQTSNEAREYAWLQLRDHSALRSSIKANKPTPPPLLTDEQSAALKQDAGMTRA